MREAAFISKLEAQYGTEETELMTKVEQNGYIFVHQLFTPIFLHQFFLH